MGMPIDDHGGRAITVEGQCTHHGFSLSIVGSGDYDHFSGPTRNLAGAFVNGQRGKGHRRHAAESPITLPQLARQAAFAGIGTMGGIDGALGL